MDTSLLIISTCCLLAGLAIGYLFALRQRGENPGHLKLVHEAEELRLSLGADRKQIEIQQSRLAELKAEMDSLRENLSTSQVKSAQLESAKVAAEQQIATQRADIQNMQETFRKDFELLAHKIFSERTEKFNQQSKLSMDQILDPLKSRLKDFQDKVEHTHKEGLMQATSLREEIKHLRETGQRMSREAENLTKALRNDNKVQGNWGEYILESILESSGLVKDREYFQQQSFTTEEGRRLQPDVMVKLPDDKWVIIDSKVALTAYDRYVNSEDQAEQQLQLKAHVNAIKTHIKGLSGKSYQDAANGKNLDFILMFIPIESAYLTALNAEPGIFNEAYDRGIVMVCPSTLIASLKIIASTWKHEYQNKNALEIAQRGKLLLEKFINFVEDMEKIGVHIDRTGSAYTDAMNKLKSGRGNLISQAQQLEELGIKTSKQIGV